MSGGYKSSKVVIGPWKEIVTKTECRRLVARAGAILGRKATRYEAAIYVLGHRD